METDDRRRIGSRENSRHVIFVAATRIRRVEATHVHVDEECDTGNPYAREDEELPDPGFPSRDVESGEEDEGNGQYWGDCVELCFVPVCPGSGKKSEGEDLYISSGRREQTETAHLEDLEEIYPVEEQVETSEQMAALARVPVLATGSSC